MGVGCCQFISNVPTAVLLSQFTTDYTNLLVAVNIGGLGTPIASLASLITLNEFRKREPQNFKKYIATFLLINFSFLVILVVTQLIANTVA
ncbi:na+/H+ antiporter NhaD and related arsenite permeases [Corallococcus sp. CAG:1435]|nr:na+/H+ antiporter NhaD and related arsenite permeases [Corallococcus sp. CAG:1435]